MLVFYWAQFGPPSMAMLVTELASSNYIRSCCSTAQCVPDQMFTRTLKQASPRFWNTKFDCQFAWVFQPHRWAAVKAAALLLLECERSRFLEGFSRFRHSASNCWIGCPERSNRSPATGTSWDTQTGTISFPIGQLTKHRLAYFQKIMQLLFNATPCPTSHIWLIWRN